MQLACLVMYPRLRRRDIASKVLRSLSLSSPEHTMRYYFGCRVTLLRCKGLNVFLFQVIYSILSGWLSTTESQKTKKN